LFNTSFQVTTDIVPQCLEWVKEELIPEVSRCVPGVFHDFFEVVSVHEEAQRVFSLQWYCSDLSLVQILDDVMALELIKLPAIFGEKVLHFSSLMKRV